MRPCAAYAGPGRSAHRDTGLDQNFFVGSKYGRKHVDFETDVKTPLTPLLRDTINPPLITRGSGVDFGF